MAGFKGPYSPLNGKVGSLNKFLQIHHYKHFINTNTINNQSLHRPTSPGWGAATPACRASPIGVCWAERMPSETTTDPACERCGSFEVLEIAGKFLCADCVAQAGCGCAGHGSSEDH